MTRAPAAVRLFAGILWFAFFLVFAALPRSADAQVHTNTSCSGSCPAGIIVDLPTYADISPLPMSGPYTFTFRVRNPNAGTLTGSYETSCPVASSQITCTTNPINFTLASGGSRTVTVTYSVKGIGHFRMKVRAILSLPDSTVTLDVGQISVLGASIIQPINPIAGGYFAPEDTLKSIVTDTSGIQTAGIVVKVDDTTRASTLTTLSSTSYAVNTLFPGVLNRAHKWTTFACAVSGRCDSVSVPFQGAPWATILNLDDSLPFVLGEGSTTGLIGGLPLPPVSLRGCPVNKDDPEIALFPGGALSQQSLTDDPTAQGLVFTAVLNTRSDSLKITANFHDYKLADSVTCTKYKYASRFLWEYFSAVSKTDTLWDSYPYGDGAPMAFMEPTKRDEQEGLEAPFELGFAGPVHGPQAGDAPWWKAASIWVADREAVRTAQRELDGRGGIGGGRSMFGSSSVLPSPGAIKASTFTLTLNGTTIVTGGAAVPGHGVVVVGLSNLIATVTVPVSDTLVNKYYVAKTFPHGLNGGWNELHASISDTTNHTTSVRTRFVQLAGGASSAPLAITPLRDFRHLDQSECAAFGSFQCGSVVATVALPGFVSRDRNRGLHLIYRSGSQKSVVQLPLGIYLSRLQLKPLTLDARAYVGGAGVGPQLSYAGTTGVPLTGQGVALGELADEPRALVTELNPASGQASIRDVQSVITQTFSAASKSDTVVQPVVQLYLTDTTSTRFGSGWQLAELSRLILGQNWKGVPAAIWLDGDGSYTIFTKSGSNWVSPTGENAVLTELTTQNSLNYARYVIQLSNGARIGFRQSGGWQAWTSDLAKNFTRFNYDTTSMRLTSIVDPSGAKYTLSYTTGRVSSISMQQAGGASTRTVATLGYNSGSKNLAFVVMPGDSTLTDTTRFGYVSDTAFANRGAYLDSIVDPRSKATAPIITLFSYDVSSQLPTYAMRPALLGTVNYDTLAIREPWRRPAPRTGYGRAGQPRERLAYAGQVRGTFFGAARHPTDYTVDPFGGPTLVDRISPPAYIGNPDDGLNGGLQFNVIGYGGDDIRRIVRDSLGRVLRITAAPDSASIADSVIYRYSALGVVDRVIRNTMQFPIATNSLDTLTVVYDSLTLPSVDFENGVALPGGWCVRQRKSIDAMGGKDTINYVSGVGTASCLPVVAVSMAGDTTGFGYTVSGSNLVPGSAAGARPISIRDPQGIHTNISYDSRTWNTIGTVRLPDGATQTQFLGKFGLADSTVNAVGVKTRVLYDTLGRVKYAKTGTGSLSPTSHVVYDKSGNAMLTELYPSSDADLKTATGPRDTTRTFFNRWNQADSTLHPGSRSGQMARKETYKYDAFGVRAVTMPGNGSLVNAATNWRGLVTERDEYQVGLISHDGEPFANGDTLSRFQHASYTPLQLEVFFPDDSWSPGTQSSYAYDNKGQLVSTRTTEGYIGGVSSRGLAYSRVGQLVADTVVLRDSVKVVQQFQYNRRGQRIVAHDTVTQVGHAAGSFNKASWTYYNYNNATGRLTSTFRAAKADTTGSGRRGYLRIGYLYGAGGRDSVVVRKLNPGWPLPSAAGDMASGDSLVTRTFYDAEGRVASRTDSSMNWHTVLYDFSAGTPEYRGYDLGDELHSYASHKYLGDAFVTARDSLTYATDGTRRLLGSDRYSTSDGTFMVSTYNYDSRGNRRAQTGVTFSVGGFNCPSSTVDSLYYGSDNQLVRRKNAFTDCGMSGYVNDHAGNRMVQVDTVNGTGHLTAYNYYSAGNQLAYSATVVGHAADDIYQQTWNWYDGQGRRVNTLTGNTANWAGGIAGPKATFAPRSTLYIYDGSDVAMTISMDSTGHAGDIMRYVYDGIDHPLAIIDDFPLTSGILAMVGDFQGSSNSTWRSDGTRELFAKYWASDPFGANQKPSTVYGNSTETGTGFSGASTPNSATGFVYMRNRWYDPQTGRFLTQDPIGLAGGVNLYAYAGNNPISFSDPFGLNCTPKERSAGNCSQSDVGNHDIVSVRRSYDPCSVYTNSGGLHGICTTVSSPGGPPGSSCTARCLADSYVHEGLDKAKSIGPITAGKYLFNDHPACYAKCGYTLVDFARDFGNAQGSRDRIMTPVPWPVASPVDDSPNFHTGKPDGHRFTANGSPEGLVAEAV